jgi:TRAP-type mannitol/chloroaromatic compound transport system permease small subunit
MESVPSLAGGTLSNRTGGKMRLFLKASDLLSEWAGKIFSWLILALTGVLVIEVLARYIFRSPTVFALDLTWMIFGVYTIMGAAYTHLAGGHVRIDLLSNLLPSRKRAILEVILYLIFFFPLLFVLSVSCTELAITSWVGDEKSSTSIWRPPVYPFKIAMMVGFYLLALQGVAQFIKQIYELIRGES